MKNFIFTVVIFSFISGSLTAKENASPYAGQEERMIKALSLKEIDGLLNGKGMGMAKAAELNHYPGPKHVLELVSELGLSDEQQNETKLLFKDMKKLSMKLGKKIIEKESYLEARFRAGNIDNNELKTILVEVGKLRASLRYAHLSTHLKQKTILNKKQIKHYDMLRGYNGKHAGHKHEH